MKTKLLLKKVIRYIFRSCKSDRNGAAFGDHGEMQMQWNGTEFVSGSRKPTYIREQVNNNCQQFFGNITNCTFVMPAAQPVDNRNRLSRAIEATCERAQITYQNEYAAIFKVIEDRNILANLSKEEFCRMVAKCDVSCKPTGNDLKQVNITGRYPDWKGGSKTQRYLDIAETFLNAYHMG